MGMQNPVGGANPHAPLKRVIPFGKYLLLDRIAVGGMAEVFLAKSFGIEGFEKIIAIKRILPTMAEDSDFIEMFIDEAKIAGHLNHANIVPIYELGKIGDSHYIAMEYIWGKDLLQIMNRFRKMRKRMPPAMVAYIAGRMCEALEYAHTKKDRRGEALNLIHRDISPQNILVSYEGAVKLIDFGIAKAASRTTKTQAGVLKGKFGYMSPEQVRGLPIDRRSDIFAVGTCMYEMLTADRLFTGESDFSTLEKVRHAAVKPPSEVVPGVPKQFDDILMKALARDPDDRWSTASELHEALQTFMVTQSPPFTSTKLVAWMISAFSKELEDEKDKLDAYAQVGRPSVLGGTSPGMPATTPRQSDLRPTNAPASGAVPRPVHKISPAAEPMDASSLGAFNDADLQGDATMITASPFDAMQDGATAGPGAQVSSVVGDGDAPSEIDAEPTQIFFSAEEEFGDEDDPTQAFAPGQQPSMPQPGPPRPGVGLGAPAPLGLEEPTVAPSFDASGAPFAMPPGAAAPTTLAPQLRTDGAPQKKRLAFIGAAAAVVLLGVIAGVAAFSRPATGTIEVRTVPEDVKAEVRVDGVPRGMAPVRIEGVAEGSRIITIQAEGYRPVQRQVSIENGTVAMLDVALISRPGTAAIDPTASAMTAAADSTTPSEPGTAVTEAGEDEEEEQAENEEEEQTQETEAEAEAEEEEEKAHVAASSMASSMQRTRTRGSSSRDTAVMSTIMRIDRSEAEMIVRGGRGTLIINTIPWARVFVDGRDTGKNTPTVPGIPVDAGRHRIGLKTSDGEMHNVTVEVSAGETVRVMRRL